MFTFFKSMKDNFFKSEIKSCFAENCETPVYNGSSDLYPKRNRNLINNLKSTEAAIKIQRFWRNYIIRQNELNKQEKKQIQLKKERFWSWFPF